jgi:hypothetical protein
MPPPSPQSLPLGEHRAPILAYLRGVTLPLQSVAWTIIEERRRASCDDLMLRSKLVLWACAACGGGEPELADALPVAAAFDLFDRFMLLHDELVEKDVASEIPAARFAPVVARWGLGQSLNAGDALYAMALRALAQDVGNAERRLQTASLVARAVLKAVEGRTTDVERRAGTRGLLTRVRSVRRRSAALTGAALESGALIAGATDSICRGFNRAGLLLAAAAGSGDARLAERLADKALASIERCISDQRQLDGFHGLARHVATHAA